MSSGFFQDKAGERPPGGDAKVIPVGHGRPSVHRTRCSGIKLFVAPLCLLTHFIENVTIICRCEGESIQNRDRPGTDSDNRRSVEKPER